MTMKERIKRRAKARPVSGLTYADLAKLGTHADRRARELADEGVLYRTVNDRNEATFFYNEFHEFRDYARVANAPDFELIG